MTNVETAIQRLRDDIRQIENTHRILGSLHAKDYDFYQSRSLLMDAKRLAQQSIKYLEDLGGERHDDPTTRDDDQTRSGDDTDTGRGRQEGGENENREDNGGNEGGYQPTPPPNREQNYSRI